LGIEHFFEDVLAYADREDQQTRSMSKGDKLRHFMQQEDIYGHPTIIVGDSVEEIEIAQEQGLISVAITGGCVSEERLRAAHPDYVIHSLHDLKPVLAERGFVS
jgi:phosphoglycolate phosphatase